MQDTLIDIYNSLISIYKSILNDKQLLIIIAFSSFIFIGLFFYLYNKFIKPNISSSYVTNNEFINNSLKEENNEDVLILFFKTEWCPHCKKAMPEWNEFTNYVDKLNDKNDYVIRHSIIDCDKQEKIAEKYNIEAYPSIILLYKKVKYEYDASPNKNNLIKFLESSTNK